MAVKTEHNSYKKSSSWISRLSICARGILTGTEQKHDQISILPTPEMPFSPESSDITSIGSNYCGSNVTFITPSPSSSSSSLATHLSTEKDNQSPQKQQEHQHQSNVQHEYWQPPLNCSNYITTRLLPTQRRSPGRKRHPSIDDRKSSKGNSCDEDICTMALNSLVEDTLTYFVDTTASSTESHGNGPHLETQLVEKLKSRLVSPTPVHPSLLKLANDLLEFMNEAPPLTVELRQLKPKLEVCLLIHSKAVD
ncbi:hypothetical protein BCR42DRAFT_392333 [Absidia repens]|uniref:Uncharacterized protein n=1 Tax=Absidia repens TaxID=90262 RepID=A0A1X2IH65_9FUNG|nr:hypothetical protein BCR42DRAFT_392333 [Absidia repens]